MKQFFGILVVLGIAAKSALSQDTIFDYAYTAPELFYFDDSADAAHFFIDTAQTHNIWQIGEPQKFVFSSAYSQPFAMVTDTLLAYPPNNVSSFEFVVTTDDHTYIEFRQRYNTDRLHDGLVIEVSDDGGASWVNILDHPVIMILNFPTPVPVAAAGNQMGFGGDSNGWISSSIMNDENCWFQRFRFTFYSDSIETNRDGWMIDDFVVNCIGTDVDQTESSQSFDVFPNPAVSFVELQLDFKKSPYQIVIKDLLANVLIRTTERRVDVSSLAAGVYVVEVLENKNRFVSKMIKR